MPTNPAALAYPQPGDRLWHVPWSRWLTVTEVPPALGYSPRAAGEVPAVQDDGHHVVVQLASLTTTPPLAEDPPDDVVDELRAIGLGTGLGPSGGPGCSGIALGHAGTPGSCPHPVEYAARHLYRRPRPRWTTLLLCRHHARLYPDAWPAGEAEAAEVERRRAALARALAPATRSTRRGPDAGL